MTATEVQEHTRQAFEYRKRAEAILAKSTGDTPLTEEQDREVDGLLDRADASEKNAERSQKILDAERRAADAKPNGGGSAGDKPGTEQRLSDADLQRRSFVHFLRTGSTRYELRDQSASLDTEGGYVMPGPTILSEVLKEVDDAQNMRMKGRVLPAIPANGTLGVPYSDNSSARAEWSAELTTADPTDVTFGGRELKPNYLTYEVRISRSLLSSSVIDVSGFVRSEFAIRAGETMEEAYISGTGQGQPLGLFTPAAHGLPASRDVETAGNAVAYDDVVDVLYSLKSQYMRNADFFMHRLALKSLVKLKGTDGHPIWRVGLAPSDPSMIMGRPYTLSEFAPSGGTGNAFGTGEYVLAVGDFQKYWICDSTMMQVQRLEELYARQNKIGFIVRQQTDGMPVLSEAFARLKIK